MTGQESDNETKMILELLQREQIMYAQDIVKHLGISKPTFYRRIKDLKDIIDTDRVRGKARYFLRENRARIGTVDKTPSDLDCYLLDECKKMVSRIILSGLLQPSYGEMEESIEKNTKDLPQEIKDKVWKPDILTQETIEENKNRRQARQLLLMQCGTLHESLRWFVSRRDVIIPGWWGTDHYQEFVDTTSGWRRESERSVQGRHLLFWMEYYLGAIDVLSRHLATFECKKRSETKKGKSERNTLKK